ncbi:hypothetical protein [Tautonia plasticadhaerens]|uniref:Uncharacterized protein n=1 Tax=Tautonia plasticadhaerens TaxID=2527974 RepID=A0A518H3C8_9BACT|nr:hypothetical protein [Tautonia plasticadhaerens]QDV35355.1 hypothetical protein ElP_32580 [Tautonia plasticadhaerens]
MRGIARIIELGGGFAALRDNPIRIDLQGFGRMSGENIVAQGYVERFQRQCADRDRA